MILLKIRDFLSFMLSYVPMSLFMSIRSEASQSRWFGILFKFLIKYVRYRKIDVDIRQFELPDSPEIFFQNDGSYISRQLFWLGRKGYEHSEANLWQYLCSHEEIKSVVEMGANIGYFSVLGGLSSDDVRYVAIEANPRTVTILENNIRLNGLTNVEVISAAVVGYKTEGTAELFIPIEESTQSAPTGAYVGGGESINRQSSQSIRVQTIQARDVMLAVDLIKLDIEGYEFIVLHSILDQIETLRPLIWVEVRRNTHELRGLLSKLSIDDGYQIYAIGKKQLYKVSSSEITKVVLQDSYDTRDVIVVPTEKMHIIEEYSS